MDDKISVLDRINQVGMQLGACCKNTVLSQKNREKMEEILNDYLAYSSEAGTWKEDVMEMKKWCEMKD